MSKQAIGFFPLLCALFLLVVPGTAAQPARPDGVHPTYRTDQSFYVNGRLGLNFYGGDRDVNAANEIQRYIENIGFSAGLEAGYAFSKRFSLGLLYLAGYYPRIKDDQDEQGRPYPRPYYQVIDPDRTSNWRRHVAVIGRAYVSPERRVSPYAQMGVHASFGKINGATQLGAGPTVGIGIDTQVSDRLGLFLELHGIFAFDDDALDLADTRAKRVPNTPRGIDASDFDSFTFFGFGLRYTLARRPRLEVACAGPDTLTVGETGIFNALIDEDAPRPLTYEWAFGDGATAYGAPAAHAFARPDSFTVRVTVSDGTHTATATCPVRVDPIPSDPTLACGGPDSLHTGEPGTFTARITGEPRPFAIYTWDFKDGHHFTVRDTQPQTHSFTKPGTYAVTVTTSYDGRPLVAMCSVTVAGPPGTDCTLRDLKEIFFERNKSTFTAVVRLFLQENRTRIKNFLVECPHIPVEIQAYASANECTLKEPCPPCPEVGEAACRQWLACERAHKIKTFYEEEGILKGRITITSPQCAVDP